MRKQVSDAELLDVTIDSVKNALYHVFPGTVQAFHAGSAGLSAAAVDVVPSVNDVRFDTETFARISEPWPVIPNIPIAYPKGGGYVIQFPLAPGDRVTLIAYDMDPTLHRLNGAAQTDPMDTSRHTGAYWVCLPNDITNPGAPSCSAAAATSLVVGKDGSTQQIVFNGSTIALGNPATDFVAMASQVANELSKIQVALSDITAPSGGGKCTVVTPYTPGSVASSLVQTG